MRVNVVMPKMGESVNEGTVIKWHKKVGDKIKKDEIIFEISTDKVDTEIPSPEEGTLIEIKVFEQETVPVDTIVAVISTNGESEQDSAKVITEQTDIPSTTQVGGNTIDIVMPKMGESVMEGTIIKWHKKIGEQVKKDEILFEISTDKVDTEVPSAENGVLTEILVTENQTVEVGTIVARLSASGGLVKPKHDDKKITETPKTETMQPQARNVETKKEEKQIRTQEKLSRFFSPLVLNIAQKENVSLDELYSLKGSGIEGRVTKNDILNYIKNNKINSKSADQVISSPSVDNFIEVENEDNKQDISFSGEQQIIPMDNIRQKIMFHMVKSRDTSVHVTGVLEVDMSIIYNYLKQNKDLIISRDNIKLTYLPFISYAVIKALREFPFLNASIQNNDIILKNVINLGIAVAVEPNGLIVPNIKNADQKNIKGLALSLQDISNRARNKKLLPDDIMGGTFTITNYGVFGSLFGTPIINQPEVGILGVGSIVKKPIVIEQDGQDLIAIRPMMYLSLSHDHRLVDGMLGGKFLQNIKQTLEKFDVSIV